MLSFKKVVKSTSKKENPDKKDQKNYMDKVKVLSNSCISFVKYLKKINENTDLSEMEKAFRTSFKVPMSKNKMLSRTSKKLHEMDKKLLKLKGKFEFEDVEKYDKVFVFEAKKADKNDYIKRSAIDDETIANTFNSEIPRILKERKQEISEKKEALKELLEKSEKVQDAGRKSIKAANEVTEVIDQAIAKIEKQKDADAKDKKDIIGTLEENKDQLQVAIKKSENHAAKMKETVVKLPKGFVVPEKNLMERLKKELELSGISNKGIKATLDVSLEDVFNILNGTGVITNQQLSALSKYLKNAGVSIPKISSNKQRMIGLGRKVESEIYDSNDKTYIFSTNEDLKKIKDYKKEEIVNVIIGDKVQEISDELFAGFSKLKTVQLGKNCKKIGNSAFFNCVALKVINLENVTTIGNNAFDSCVSLTKVDLGSATSIGSYAFSDCKNALRSVELKNVNVVSAYAFYQCESLEKVSLGIATIINPYAFCGCKKLENVNLENVTTIGNNAFNGCASLVGAEAVLNAVKVTTVGDSAFEGCKKLEGINLKKVESIGNNAFKDCEGIGVVILPENNFKGLKDTILSQTGKSYNPWKNSKSKTARFVGGLLGSYNKVFKSGYIAFGTPSES